jgi:hypothetical protein
MIHAASDGRGHKPQRCNGSGGGAADHGLYARDLSQHEGQAVRKAAGPNLTLTDTGGRCARSSWAGRRGLSPRFYNATVSLDKLPQGQHP